MEDGNNRTNQIPHPPLTDEHQKHICTSTFGMHVTARPPGPSLLEGVFKYASSPFAGYLYAHLLPPPSPDDVPLGQQVGINQLHQIHSYPCHVCKGMRPAPPVNKTTTTTYDGRRGINSPGVGSALVVQTKSMSQTPPSLLNLLALTKAADDVPLRVVRST